MKGRDFGLSLFVKGKGKGEKMEFDIKKIEINAAFYELFENTFGEDFFEILAKLRPTKRIASLRSRKKMVTLNLKKANGETLTEEEQKLLEKNPGKWQDLSEEEAEELMNANLEVGTITKRMTPRIAYIGSKLYKHEYRGSMDEYYSFLANYDASEFLKEEVIKEIWEKVTLDQAIPKSAKNA